MRVQAVPSRQTAFLSTWRIRIGYLRFLVRPLTIVRCLEGKNLVLANSGACPAIAAWRSFASYCDHYGPSALDTLLHTHFNLNLVLCFLRIHSASNLCACILYLLTRTLCTCFFYSSHQPLLVPRAFLVSPTSALRGQRHQTRLNLSNIFLLRQFQEA